MRLNSNIENTTHKQLHGENNPYTSKGINKILSTTPRKTHNQQHGESIPYTVS